MGRSRAKRGGLKSGRRMPDSRDMPPLQREGLRCQTWIWRRIEQLGRPHWAEVREKVLWDRVEEAGRARRLVRERCGWRSLRHRHLLYRPRRRPSLEDFSRAHCVRRRGLSRPALASCAT